MTNESVMTTVLNKTLLTYLLTYLLVFILLRIGTSWLRTWSGLQITYYIDV